MKHCILPVVILGLLLMSLPAQAQDSSLKVLVHSDHPVTSLSKSHVSQLLLQKGTQWDSGLKVLPVDQTDSASVREKFSKAVHGKSVSAVKSYWQKSIFSGRDVPPPEKASDRAVIDYVKANPGAIGYVSAGATLGSGIKAVSLTD